VILNGLRTIRAEPAAELAAAGNVWFDIATQEGIAGVAALAKKVPLERLLFGSYAPFQVIEAAVLKLKEAGIEKEATPILTENARRVLAAGK
jgi:predicted TIM-barrel fold metal-dependent hydrolase